MSNANGHGWRFATAVSGAVIAVAVTGCSPQRTADAPATTASTTSASVAAQPKTLEAATTAAREKSDRFASGDFSGEWLLFSKQVRDAISQSDYVTYAKACSKNGLPVGVTGVRMEGTGKAIVRLEVLGFQDARTMVYEDGQWVQEPTDKMANDLGKPVQQWIADTKAQGSCGQ